MAIVRCENIGETASRCRGPSKAGVCPWLTNGVVPCAGRRISVASEAGPGRALSLEVSRGAHSCPLAAYGFFDRELRYEPARPAQAC